MPNSEAKTQNLAAISAHQIARQALGYIRQGRAVPAEKLLRQYLFWPYALNLLPLLRVRAELYQRNHDFVNEAATYHQILQLASNDKSALRGRTFAVLSMGAPHLAVQYANLTPEVFSETELLQFNQARVGRSIRWGTLEAKAGLGQQRFVATDKALSQNAAMLKHHADAHQNGSLSGLRTEFDRIVALRDRIRMQDAIGIYLKLKQQGIDFPAYVLVAVADAYLHQRQPKAALGLYLKALDLSKHDRDYPNREWQLKLFDAYIDANEFDNAQALIDQIANEIQPILQRGLRGVEVDNELYGQARVDQVRARLYADQINEGQDLLEKTLAAAPFNLDARLAKGDLLRFREQPRAAQRQHASILVDDPGNVFAAIGVAEIAIALNDGTTAQRRLDHLILHYPENREVQRVHQLLRAYSKPLATVTSGWGRSPTGGGNRGNQNWQVDTLLHSSAFNQNWRGFVHAFNAEADFDTTTGVRRRIGAGLAYRSPLWQISAEVNQDQTEFDRYGLTLETAWTPDDHWQLEGKFESNSNNIPLQASASGIRMRSFEFGINYNHNESRSFNATAGYSWFGDGNCRIEASANWQERWWSGPTYKLDTILSIAGSDNSLINAGYFNPRSDFSIDAQVINEWMLWQKYQRNFKHRVVLGAGEYWQQGFASGMTSLFRYEQELNLDPYRSLNYGVAYERHPFDGARNEITSVFFNLIWHL